jgi:hypothetical protein
MWFTIETSIVEELGELSTVQHDSTEGRVSGVDAGKDAE